MDTAGRADVSVRAARPADAAAVAEVQLQTWRAGCAGILPPAALDGLDAAEAEAQWRDAVVAPPTPAHLLLIALDEGRLVGFAAVGPGSDDDAGTGTGEIFELLVAPGAQRAGHGSRLLAAAVEHLGEQGYGRAVTWRFEADQPAGSFLTSAGWATDGSRRTLEAGEQVVQVRWHTDLGISVTVI